MSEKWTNRLLLLISLIFVAMTIGLVWSNPPENLPGQNATTEQVRAYEVRQQAAPSDYVEREWCGVCGKLVLWEKPAGWHHSRADDEPRHATAIIGRSEVKLGWRITPVTHVLMGAAGGAQLLTFRVEKVD